MKRTQYSAGTTRVLLLGQCCFLVMALAASSAQTQQPEVATPYPFGLEPTTSPYPETAGQQVRFEVSVASASEDVLIAWATEHKAKIKRVEHDDREQRKPTNARTRATPPILASLFGSEVPVPLLFDGEIRKSLFERLGRDTRTNVLMTPAVTTHWNQQVSVRTGSDNTGQEPFGMTLTPTPVGNGELRLKVSAELPEGLTLPAPVKTQWDWSLRARNGQTLLIPVTMLESEVRLVLLVRPEILAAPAQAGPPQTSPSPGPFAIESPNRQPPRRTLPAPAPQSTHAEELLQVTAHILVAKTGLIPEKTVELDRQQLDAKLKAVKADRTAFHDRLQATVRLGQQAHLSPPYPQGEKKQYELKITPERVGDQITLDLHAELKALWPGFGSPTSTELKITAGPGKTVVLPLPIHHPDGRKVAILLQASPMPAAIIPQPKYATVATPNSEATVAVFQMLLLDVDSRILTRALEKTSIRDSEVTLIDVERPRKADSPKRASRKQTAEQRTFRLSGTESTLFVAELRKQDDSFRVISRPQVRTMLEVAAAMSIHSGADESQAGTGKLDLTVKPRRSGEFFLADTTLRFIGPGRTVAPETWTPGFSFTSTASQKCAPGQTAVLTVGGKGSDRSTVLLTDLVTTETVQVPPRPATAPARVPAWRMADENATTLPRGTGQPVARPRPEASAMRLVTIEAITGSAVTKGDTVDVLLVLTEGGTPESARIETLCESVTVSETARASFGNTTSVTLLVEKSLVEKLLLAQLKGTLRLSIHRSSVQSTAPGSFLPSRTQSWRQHSSAQAPPTQSPQPVVPASGFQSPARPNLTSPENPPTRPRSEVQQVLEEVREMRKLIHGLREDMNSLRNSVGGSAKRQPAERAGVAVTLHRSQTISRPANIAQTRVVDAEIVAVEAVSPRSLKLTGRKAGRTYLEIHYGIPSGGQPHSPMPDEVIAVEVVAGPVGGPPSRPPKAARHEPVFPGREKPDSPRHPVARPAGPVSEVRVPLNQSHRLRRDMKFSRIAVAAPTIADVIQYSPFEAGIVGRKTGSTSITVWYEGEDRPETIRVAVGAPQSPLSTTGSPKADTARRQIEQALGKEVSLEIEDGSLKDALRLLSSMAEVNVTIDTAGLEEEEIPLDTRVSLHLSGVSLRSTLRILLDPLGLETMIEDEVLKVTSKRRAMGQQLVIAYQVADLALNSRDGQPDFDELISLVTTVVDPDSWEEVGGPGSIAASTPTKALVIRQTENAHEEIQRLFSALRKWRLVEEVPQKATLQKDQPVEDAEVSRPAGRLLEQLRDRVVSPKPAQPGASSTQREGESLLRRRISLSENKTPLKDVLNRIASQIELQVAMEKAGLAEAGVTESTPVSLVVDQVMSQSALNLILEPLKLAYVVEDGKVLRVSSQKRLNTPTVRVYSVRKAVADPEVLDLDGLSTLIQDTIQPESWQRVGGPGSIATNAKTKSLVIRQSDVAHGKIVRLLEDLGDLLVISGEEVKAAASKVR